MAKRTFKTSTVDMDVTDAGVPHARAHGIETLIEAFHERIKEAAAKMSISDYVRLLQMQQELSTDEPADIEVTWIEKSQLDQLMKLRRLGPNADLGGVPTGTSDHPDAGAEESSED